MKAIETLVAGQQVITTAVGQFEAATTPAETFVATNKIAIAVSNIRKALSDADEGFKKLMIGRVMESSALLSDRNVKGTIMNSLYETATQGDLEHLQPHLHSFQKQSQILTTSAQLAITHAGITNQCTPEMALMLHLAQERTASMGRSLETAIRVIARDSKNAQALEYLDGTMGSYEAAVKRLAELIMVGDVHGSVVQSVESVDGACEYFHLLFIYYGNIIINFLIYLFRRLHFKHHQPPRKTIRVQRRKRQNHPIHGGITIRLRTLSRNGEKRSREFK